MIVDDYDYITNSGGDLIIYIIQINASIADLRVLSIELGIDCPTLRAL